MRRSSLFAACSVAGVVFGALVAGCSKKPTKISVSRPTGSLVQSQDELKTEETKASLKTVAHKGQANSTFDSGAVLYTKHCASCHGALEVSRKRNKSPQDIASAIATLPEMAHLKRLTTRELEAISEALTSGVALKASGGANPYMCEVDKPARGDDSLRRLTRKELQNTYLSLFSTNVAAATVNSILDAVPPDSTDGVFENKDSSVTYSHISAYSTAAVKLSEEALRSSGFLTRTSGCSTFDDACFSNFLDRFGSRLLRKKLDKATRDSFHALYADAGKGEAGFRTVLGALLQSPSFLYKVEVGEGTPDSTGLVTLSATELASRLAYATTAAPPDDTLWQKALNGSLLTASVYTAEVERLTASPQFKARVREFLGLLTGTESPHSLNYSPYLLSGLNPAQLATDAKAELALFFEDLAFGAKPGTYADFLLSQKAYSTSAQVAAVYGGDEGGMGLQTTTPALPVPPNEEAAATTQVASWPIQDFAFNKNTPNLNNNVMEWTPWGFDSRARKNFSWPGGVIKVEITARGELLNNIAPIAYVALLRTGQTNPAVKWDTLSVSNPNAAPIEVGTADLPEGDYTIEVSSTNDEYIPGTGDRNLWVRNVRLLGTSASQVATMPGSPSNISLGDALSVHRKGVMTRAGSLMTGKDDTHLVHRGLLVRRNLLCDVIVAPPITAESAADFTPPVPSVNASMMEQIRTRTAAAQCAVCHVKINPPGFLLESFDSLGRARTGEDVYDPTGRLLKTHPVAVSMVPNIESASEPAVSSWAEYAEAMSRSSKAPACFASRWVEFVAQRVPQADDACLLHDMYGLLQGKAKEGALAKYPMQPGNIPALLKGALLAPSFKYVNK